VSRSGNYSTLKLVQPTLSKALGREFGGLQMQGVLRDIRYGVRGLRRAPAFALVSGVTLALGIGAATAVFSVINGVLIKPLPYPDSETLTVSGTRRAFREVSKPCPSPRPSSSPTATRTVHLRHSDCGHAGRRS
jgi:hypothetical protein